MKFCYLRFLMLKRFPIDRIQIWLFLVSMLLISFPWSERINSIFIALLVLHWLVDAQFLSKFRTLKKSALKVFPFFLFFFLHFIFVSRAIRFEDALQTIEVKLSFLLLPLLFSTEHYFDHFNQKWLMRLFSASCLLSAIYCFIAYRLYLYPLYGWDDLFNRMIFSSYLMHPGYYSNFFVVAIIFLSVQWITNHLSRWEKIGSVLTILFFLFILFILVSKTALIILLLFCIYLIWHYLSVVDSRPPVRVAYFLTLVAIALFIFIKVPSIKIRLAETKGEISSTGKNVKLSNSTGSRMIAWKVEWNLIKERWLAGYGTGNANEILLQRFGQEGYADLVQHQMHTHNQVFHTWLNLGLAGVLSLVLFFVFCFYYLYKNRGTIGLWTTALLLLYCFTDDALEIQSITVFCITIICLYLFQKQEAKIAETTGS